MNILAIDPSGNFDSGKGRTGLAGICGDDWHEAYLDSVNAKDFKTRYEYWDAIIAHIETFVTLCDGPTHIVLETYVTRMNGFTLGKMPETAMLLGVIVYYCDSHGIEYSFQQPSQAKTRFKDEMLLTYVPDLELRSTGRYYFKGRITNDHERDALKHLLYFKKYKEKVS